MDRASIVAQIVDLPESGGGGVVFWLVGAAVIVGLWILISRTRRRSYDDYWARRRRDEIRRINDPDMAPVDEDDEGDGRPGG
jgi:hypothetical protein